MGRKAWLFADSVEDAHAAATIFSFIETCKHHQIEPYYWFKYILQTLPSCQMLEDFEALLPFNIDKNLLQTTGPAQKPPKLLNLENAYLQSATQTFLFRLQITN